MQLSRAARLIERLKRRTIAALTPDDSPPTDLADGQSLIDARESKVPPRDAEPTH